MKRKFIIAKGLRRYTGLMFRTRKTDVLIFEFEKPTLQSIHSWFVFFPFKAKWYDSNRQLIEERIVKPFETSVIPSAPYQKLVEIPII